MELLALTASIYAMVRKRARQGGGSARGVTAPLTDRVEATFHFSKGGCQSFVAAETAGDRGQMQSSRH